MGGIAIEIGHSQNKICIPLKMLKPVNNFLMK